MGLSIPHDVFDAGPLPEESVHHGCPWRDQGGLAEEREQCQDAVEGLEVFLPLGPDSHTLAKLCKDYQIQDDWAGE